MKTSLPTFRPSFLSRFSLATALTLFALPMAFATSKGPAPRKLPDFSCQTRIRVPDAGGTGPAWITERFEISDRIETPLGATGLVDTQGRIRDTQSAEGYSPTVEVDDVYWHTYAVDDDGVGAIGYDTAADFARDARAIGVDAKRVAQAAHYRLIQARTIGASPLIEALSARGSVLFRLSFLQVNEDPIAIRLCE